MKLVLHQLKWDVHRLRLLWGLYLLILAGWIAFQPTFMVNGQGGSDTFYPAWAVVGLLGLVSLTGAIILTTPFQGTTAHWKTRPFPWGAMYSAKSIFIVAGLWLPLFLAWVLGWARLNPGSGFLAHTALFAGFLIVGVGAQSAVLAANADSFGKFFAWIAGALGVFTSSGILVVILVRTFEVLPLSRGAATEHEMACQFLILLCVLAVCALAAWTLCVSRNTLTLALVFGGIAALLPPLTGLLGHLPVFNQPQPPDLGAVRVIKGRETARPNEQLFWHTFAVSLPKGTFALPEHIEANVRNIKGEAIANAEEKRISAFLPHSVKTADIYHTLKDFYPDTVRWFHQDRQPHTPWGPSLTGTLAWHFDFHVYRWRKQGSAALAEGNIMKLRDGGLLAMESIQLQDGAVQLNAQLLVPPAFLRGQYEEQELHSRSPLRLFVVYHPASGEAYVADTSGGYEQGLPLSMRQSRLNLSLREFSVRSSIVQKSREDWLEGARLDYFEARRVGQVRDHGTVKDWEAPPRREGFYTEGDVSSIRDLALQEQPSQTQVEKYLESILYSVHTRFSGLEYRMVRDKLIAIGPRNLHLLLRWVPFSEPFDSVALDAVRHLATEENRDTLVGALEEEERLAQVFWEKRWLEQAQPILRERLRRHVPLDWRSAPYVIRIVAESKDSDTTGDLHWHFVHAEHGYPLMLEALQAVPRFDTTAAIRQAWKRALFDLGARKTELAPYMARLGSKEALRVSFYQLEQNIPREERERIEAMLEQMVPESPKAPSLLAWARANYEQLHFSEESGKFWLRN